MLLAGESLQQSYIMKRLSTFEKLPPSYLFPEIEKRKRAYLEKNPEADIISLGIGDTVLPLSPAIASAMGTAGVSFNDLDVVFVSVDPERDTLAHLRDYVRFFDPRIVGATGSPELVKRAAENFKVRYEKISAPGADPLNYSMDHSAGMYLLAPGGRFLDKFPYGMAVGEIAARIGQAIGRFAAPPPPTSPR